MNETAPYVLEMQGIGKVFPGVRALDGVDLRVRPGTVHVIVGENGAGKSTLMKIINGEYMPDSGTIFFKGRQLGKRTIQESLKLGISMIHQELSPITAMDVAENIFVGREPKVVRGIVDFKAMHRQTQDILESMQIPYHSHQMMNTLTVQVKVPGLSTYR